MGKNLCKVVSVITACLAVVFAILGITVRGGGFVDLSNIVRPILFGLASIFGVIGVLTGIKGWKD